MQLRRRVFSQTQIKTEGSLFKMRNTKRKTGSSHGSPRNFVTSETLQNSSITHNNILFKVNAPTKKSEMPLPGVNFPVETLAPPPPAVALRRDFDRGDIAASVVRNRAWVLGLRDAEEWCGVGCRQLSP
jgi:hypothetical protein